MSSKIGMLNSELDPMKRFWIEDTILELLSLWKPDDSCQIPHGFIQLLNHRPSLLYLRGDIKEDTKIHLWHCFQGILSSQDLNLPHELFTAMWHLVSVGLSHYVMIDSPEHPFNSVLETLSTVDLPHPFVTCSIVPLLKVQILYDLGFRTTFRVMVKALNHPLFLTESEMQLSEEFLPLDSQVELTLPIEQQQMIINVVRHRAVEACVDNLARYLENCSSDVLPYKAIETINSLCHGDAFFRCPGSIHSKYQLHLANSIHSIFATGRTPEVMDGIVHCPIWNVYVSRDREEWSRWLNDPAAQQKIKDTFAEYERKLTSMHDNSRVVLRRLRQIMQGFDVWHPVSETTSILPNNSIPAQENQPSISDMGPSNMENSKQVQE
ncbi:hypothetical protein C8R45DRAFT_936771 [Mycena sanguinolenta]|nr:hypothetical protein C8R45DRAFT_936771 [Mycena sanguinolenta]